ncbi:MAG: hypothetical protein ACR2J9_03310 [Gaiellales bacterium]
MRRIAIALTAALVLVVVPVAGAKSFEAATMSGDLVYRSSVGGESALSIAYVAAKTQIITPRALKGIACLDGAELYTCVTLKRAKRSVTWTVLKPVKLMHQQAGDYTITLRKAGELRDVFISGCGQVRATGTGTYSADGAAPVSYTPADTTVVIDLKP